MGKRSGRSSVPHDIDELLKKHAVTSQPEFLERRNVPGPEEANLEKKQRRLLKQNNLSKWGDMKRGAQDVEARQALKLLRMSNYLNGASYQRPDNEPLPDFYEFGVDVGSKTDLNRAYDKPKHKKNIAGSLVKSILKTEAAQALLKEHQAEKSKVVAAKEKSRMRRNQSKRNAKQRKRAGAGL
eukprot:TRINITY_DN20216_c0_g1_i1.p1 TRINITY_DN20216_c0_g1~~TRINITY_DN20216_c0_g1_i1.p1  ORF type:complete len:183 (+),score=67.56 TRINITY_DN20216_c0_g1_i1:79-627(+)